LKSGRAIPVALLPVGVLIIAMVSFQLGATIAKQLIPAVGASGATALRLALSALMLAAVWRPWRVRPNRRELRAIIAYGLAMGWMNFFFYQSLRTLPLGISVALEFAGPLAVAMLASRRPIDFLWIALAALGLVALLPLGLDSKPLAPVGVVYSLAAGLCWALYIIFGQKAGAAHGGQTAALGTLVGAVVIVPIAVAQVGVRLLSPALLPAALAVALLSSALPYSLEMFALTRLPTRTFGVLMSLDPALGALAGLCLLGEQLTLLQWAAIGSIILASAGSAATSTPALRTSLPD
jgi:inner membrane transporter RhtA